MRFLASLTNFCLKLLAFLFWPKIRPKNLENIIIYRVGHIGDITCSLPAIYSVRRTFPNAKLTLLTSAGSVGLSGANELLGEANWLDEIISYDAAKLNSIIELKNFIFKLRKHHFDAWVNLSMDTTTISREVRDMLFARLVGPRWARGWRINTFHMAVQEQSEFIVFPNEVDRVNAIVESLGFFTNPIVFGLPSSDRIRKVIDGLLVGLGDFPLVTIAPCCKRDTNKWPLDRFIFLGKYLAAQRIKVIVLGGASDASTCNFLSDSIGQSAISLAGQVSLSQSIEVLRRCELAVCLDSGVQHLASAVGTPTVSLFSFWQIPGKWFPFGQKNTVLLHWIKCNTCLLDQCPNDNACMKLISVDEVVNAVNKKLKIDPGVNYQGPFSFDSPKV